MFYGVRLAFGPFVLDKDTRELTRKDEPLRVTPKAFRLLEILIEERPKAVSKDALIERLWPEQYVTEANLPSLVAELRKLLDDRPQDPSYLRTVHRHGYAFCGTASPVADRRPDASEAHVHHRIILGTREVRLTEGVNLLGRDPEATVWLEHSSVSRRHARIVITGDRATLEDLGSKNGTFCGTDRVTEPVPLADHARLKLGSMWLTYRALPISEDTKTVGRHNA